MNVRAGVALASVALSLTGCIVAVGGPLGAVALGTLAAAGATKLATEGSVPDAGEARTDAGETGTSVVAEREAP